MVVVVRRILFIPVLGQHLKRLNLHRLSVAGIPDFAYNQPGFEALEPPSPINSLKRRRDYDVSGAKVFEKI